MAPSNLFIFIYFVQNLYVIFYLGLKYVYNMTHDIRSELRLDLENSTGGKIYELDRGFRLRDPPYYGLLIDGYWISEGISRVVKLFYVQSAVYISKSKLISNY